MQDRRTLSWALAALLFLSKTPAHAGLLDQPMPPADFSACVQTLAGLTSTAQRPLSSADFLRFATTAQYDDRVRQSMLVQTGEPTFWWDDIAATTDDQRVAEGRTVLAREPEALEEVETRFGIPKEVITAIYGIETNYGPALGRIPVLDSTVSLACLRPCTGTRPTCVSRERAYAAVRLLRDNKVKPENYRGSWAGAFGRTQFVPDSFEQLAVDFDGDGVADIVGSERDAWATAANHLRTRGGWVAGAPVYVEVKIPASEHAQFASGGKSVRQSARAMKASAWAAAGWQAVNAAGEPVPLQVTGDPDLHPFAPVGLPGPAFLVSRNFNTIYRYNNSEKYVMEVAVLANKLGGGPGIVTAWPTDDPGLSRAQIRELQGWLIQQGHTKVVADGVPGRITRDAIQAERAKKGMPASRRAGQRTMRLLMQP